MQLQEWSRLIEGGDRLCAIQAPLVDRNYVLTSLLEWSEAQHYELYYWTPTHRYISRVYRQDKQVVLKTDVSFVFSQFGAKDWERIISFLELLSCSDQAGIYVLEGVTPHLEMLLLPLETLYFQLQQSEQLRVVALLGDAFEVPLPLYPMLPVLKYPLPSRMEVRQHIADQMQQLCSIQPNTTSTEWLRPIVQACTGLPRGEIDAVLRRSLAGVDSVSTLDITYLQQQILDYKRAKLQGRGIHLLPEPDVPTAAGLDRLDETMDQIRLLLEPESELRGLRAPKSVLMWGIPGTGKSLAAKLAAKRIGGSLIAADWNGLVGDSLKSSVENVDYLLSFADQIGNAVLFFDEFDKAFAGWQSGDEKLRAISARLLTWMNDHTSPVVMMATINHLGMLPPEMIRRFEIIHFFGLPHAGALHEIFKLHLSQYFRYDFSHREWQRLLREYKGCTPAEVMKAVKAVANRRYFQDVQAGKDNFIEKPKVSVDELLTERQNFVPDSRKREVSNQIAAILNQADYALPVQGPDTSPFAEPEERLFDIDEETLRREDESTQPVIKPPLRRSCPAIEDI